MAGDLHIHTNASDGLLLPVEIVNLAAVKNLEAVGITDHDTVSGLAEALRAGKDKGIEVIPGVELSSEWDEREIHILGYYIRWQDEGFLESLEKMRCGRHERNKKMIARLRELGYDITMADVDEITFGEIAGRPHIASALVNKGFVSSVEEAFQKLLRRNMPAYVPREKVSPCRAVEIILEAGGVPVLAHPGLSGADKLIPELKACGLQGIEVYYPLHNRDMTAHYLEIAARYGFIVTGGSDFHGYNGDSHAELGACSVNTEELERLRRCREKAFKTNSLTESIYS